MLVCFLLTICFLLCCVIPLQGDVILIHSFALAISLSQLSRPMLSGHFIYMASSHLRYIQSCLFSFGINVYQYILYIPRTQQLFVSDLKLTELLVISFTPWRINDMTTISERKYQDHRFPFFTNKVSQKQTQR